jgi:deoxyhypusine synthase
MCSARAREHCTAAVCFAQTRAARPAAPSAPKPIPPPKKTHKQINWRLQDDPITANTDPEHADPAFRARTRTKIYLGYTSNLISAGVREQIRWLVQQRMVDVLVTTAGGVEEDFIKCMGHTYMGDFALKGAQAS